MGPALVQISAITFGQLNFVKCLSRPSPDVPRANPGLQGGEMGTSRLSRGFSCRRVTPQGSVQRAAANLGNPAPCWTTLFGQPYQPTQANTGLGWATCLLANFVPAAVPAHSSQHRAWVGHLPSSAVLPAL